MRNYEAIKSFEENENDEDLEIGKQEQQHDGNNGNDQISDSATTKLKKKIMNKIVVDECSSSSSIKSQRLLSLDVFRGLTVAVISLHLF